jgi:hypothetical protein
MSKLFIANTQKRAMVAAEAVMNGYIVKQIREKNGKSYNYGLDIRKPPAERVVCNPRTGTGEDD